MSPLRRETRELLGAILGGVVYVASLGRSWGFVLAPLAFFPLFHAIRDVSPPRAAWLGGVMGTVACGLGFWWVAPAIHRFGDLGVAPTALLYGLFVAIQAARFAAQAWLTARLRPRTGLALGASLAFVLAETAIPSPMRWSFAIAAVGRLELLQVAELGGPIAVALPFILTAALLSERSLSSSRWRVIALAPVALSFAYGALRLWTIDHTDAAATTVRVGLVQGAMPLGRDPVGEASALAEELRLHRALERAGADLIVWGESSVPLALDSGTLSSSLVDLVGGGVLVPTLVSAAVLEGGSERPRAYNSALLLDREGLRDRYDKRALLLFSERLPLGELSEIPYRLFPAVARFHAGERGGPREILGHPVAVTICYEDALPEAVLDSAGRRAELIVNLTNDAWFDGSPAPALHLALARLRAIENRRYLLHATNTGVTAVIDPAGRVTAEAPAGPATSLMTTAQWRSGATLFSMIGERPWWAISLLSLFLAALARGSALQPHRDRRIIPRSS